MQFHFKGPPDKLETTSPFTMPRAGLAVPELKVHNQRHVLQFQAAGNESGISLSFKLPPDSPPGTTQGTVLIGDTSYPAIIEIDEAAKIVVEPKTINWAASPGLGMGTSIRVVNAGNVARDLEPTQTITLRPADAISRGVRKAFKETDVDLVSRLVKLGEELSSEPAIELTVDLKADFRSLAAGDQRTVEITGHLPADLGQAPAWKGNLTLLGSAVEIILQVADAPQPR